MRPKSGGFRIHSLSAALASAVALPPMPGWVDTNGNAFAAKTPGRKAWRPMPHAAPLTTTMRSSFPELPFVRPPQPIKPSGQTLNFPTDEGTPASTYSASFSGRTQPKAQPIVPPVRPASYAWAGGRTPESTNGRDAG